MSGDLVDPRRCLSPAGRLDARRPRNRVTVVFLHLDPGLDASVPRFQRVDERLDVRSFAARRREALTVQSPYRYVVKRASCARLVITRWDRVSASF